VQIERWLDIQFTQDKIAVTIYARKQIVSTSADGNVAIRRERNGGLCSPVDRFENKVFDLSQK
jgi:hypothetical protein